MYATFTGEELYKRYRDLAVGTQTTATDRLMIDLLFAILSQLEPPQYPPFKEPPPKDRWK